MSKTNLGKISICPKGEYDSTVTYQPLDMVSYNGNSFLARAESKGIAPADGDDWQAISEITKSGIVTALGYEPQKPEGQLRLVKSITVDEAASVRFDGLSLQYAYIEIVLPANSPIDGANLSTYDAQYRMLPTWISAASASSNIRIATKEVYIRGGMYMANYTNFTVFTSNASMSRYSYKFADLQKPADSPIIIVQYGATCPVGTVVSVYGIDW